MCAVYMQAAYIYNGMWFVPESSDEQFQYATLFGLEDDVSGEIVIPEMFTVDPSKWPQPPYDWIVREIAAEVFRSNTHITAVVIPKSIVSIGGYAFRGCIGLSDLYVSWDDPSNVSMGWYYGNRRDVFMEVNKAAINLHVPVGKKAAYQSSEEWRDFNIVDDGDTISVNPGVKTIHYVTENGTGKGSSWTDASGNIQEMIDKAAIGDEIWVAKGTYYPTRLTDIENVRSKTFKLRDGVHLYGGFAENEAEISERVTSDKDNNGIIEAWEFVNETILSGDIDHTDGKEGNSYCVVTCLYEFKRETVFDGFTVTEGGVNNRSKSVVISSSEQGCGGGIYAYGKITVSRCVVTKNSAKYGSGIYNDAGTVEQCLVFDNDYSVDNREGVITNGVFGNGGGIYNDKGIVKNCIIKRNALSCYANSYSNGAAMGGGIYNYAGIVANCCVYNNYADASGKTFSRCGGVYNYGYVSSGKTYTATLYNSTIVNNRGGYSENNLTNSDNTLTYNTIYEQFVDNFVNYDGNDFRLKSTSEYIDAGSTENIPEWIINGTDLAGNPRIYNGKIDKGAYEYNGSQSGIKELQQTKVTVYFNTATKSVAISGLQGNETIYFYNITGNMLLTRHVTGETENIPVDNLPAGLYFVKANNGQALKWVKKQ